MKKLTLIFVIIFSFLLMKPSVSGEITDMEWNVIDQLVVTYYKGSSGWVDWWLCTAFNSNGSPIVWGGAGLTQIQDWL